MARRRFFVPQVRRGLAELTGADAEHLVRVLRAEVDEVFEISDNQELYLARITIARKSTVIFEVIEQLEIQQASVRLTLASALFKFDHFEWLLEKATELGVDDIVPFEAVRTERGLLQASKKRRVRWERIALEASQQARRWRLPVIADSVSFGQAIQSEATKKLFLDEDPAALPILQVLLAGISRGVHMSLMLGPEGGWTETERASAIANGWLACSLGSTVLRAETAGIAGLAILRNWVSVSC